MDFATHGLWLRLPSLNKLSIFWFLEQEQVLALDHVEAALLLVEDLPIDEQPDDLPYFKKIFRLMSKPGLLPMPSDDASYRPLYTEPSYRNRMKRKMKLLKAELTVDNVRLAFGDSFFWEELDRIEETFPEEGGREGLNLLVGKC